MGTGIGFKVARKGVDKAVTEVLFPLKHEDIIRQQAKDKNLPADLIAAVIYAESRFRSGLTSSAGAIGLMQLTPDTAADVARQSGGNQFVLEDLDTPQVNIAYGSWRLRHMLQRFEGNVMVAVAAYNAGPENAQKWLNQATAAQHSFRVSDIPFSETKAYVQKVLEARAEYRGKYSEELGL